MAKNPGLFRFENILQLLLVCVPAAFFLHYRGGSEVFVFILSCLSIVPLAGLMGRATEHLAEHMGEGMGGLLNATFGNAAELIIALMALRAGLHDVVKASITGSIIGNILLVLGLALLGGGLRIPTLRFNAVAAGVSTTLLMLAATSLVVPTLYYNTGGDRSEALSLEIAIVLFVTYVLYLVFSLRTHGHLYVGAEDGNPSESDDVHGAWSQKFSLFVLLISTVFVALMSELLVESLEHAASALGMTEIFVGVILVAIIGNAAEHSTAVLVALKNKMDLAMNIAVGSSVQVALFVAPVLVFASYAFGNPMDLHFSTFEVVAVVISVLAVRFITVDGESNWMEGVQVLAVYVILAMAFYFLPPT
jgi:Ca2+:H+ antiporter